MDDASISLSTAAADDAACCAAVNAHDDPANPIIACT
jgi:hypothetical protein